MEMISMTSKQQKVTPFGNRFHREKDKLQPCRGLIVLESGRLALPFFRYMTHCTPLTGENAPRTFLIGRHIECAAQTSLLRLPDDFNF